MTTSKICVKKRLIILITNGVKWLVTLVLSRQLQTIDSDMGETAMLNLVVLTKVALKTQLPMMMAGEELMLIAMLVQITPQ
jgi:hypothetical protein